MLDLGTGTGRLLALLADRFERAIGIDASHDMLAAARSELDRAGDPGAGAAGRPDGPGGGAFAFDLVTIHQVLHYLDDPGGAIREAARALAPGGRLLIVDFAPHGLEVPAREDHAHRRLGFSHGEIARLVDQVLKR